MVPPVFISEVNQNVQRATLVLAMTETVAKLIPKASMA